MNLEPYCGRIPTVSLVLKTDQLNLHQKMYHPIKIGSLELEGNLFLAPMAGFTDRVYRSICRGMGADLSFTELASAEALLRGGKNTEKLIQRGEGEKPYFIQLFGHDPDRLYKAALSLAPLKPEGIDLNSGCPVPKVVKHGAGSALMKDPALLGKIIEKLVKASKEALGNIPVSVKIRSGWDSLSINYRECALIAEAAGAAMLTLHPRTRGQGYGGKSDWSHIGELCSCLKIPVTGSGDLYTKEDAEKMFRETGCAALMFARGAVGNPYIFKKVRAHLNGETYNEPDFSVRMETAFFQLEKLSLELGEKKACKEMRKHFSAYTKGVQGSASLRNALVKAESIQDYRAVLASFN